MVCRCLLHHDHMLAWRKCRQVDAAGTIAHIPVDDRILVVDINVQVIAVRTQVQIVFQLVAAALQDCAFFRRDDGDRTRVGSQNWIGQRNRYQCEAQQQIFRLFHNTLLLQKWETSRFKI